MSEADPSPKATVEQLARQCGVSAVTVSRALRADAPVAEATRKRVLKAAEEAGYQPRVRMGRPRRASRAERPCIEVVMGLKFHSVFYSVLLTAIERELAEKGHDCIIRSANGGFAAFVRLCEVLRASPHTPTLVVGYLPVQQLRTLLEVRPRALLVDHTGDPRLALPYSSIGFDNTEAARMMVRHLLAAGRRRILLLNGFADHYFAREIDQGYREALAQAGVPADPALIFETDYTPESAVEKLTGALDAGLAFDAVFTNDEMAAAVLYTLRKRGLRVPEDVAVGGCDGLSFGPYLTPPLTTVLLDHVVLGRLAVTHILNPDPASALPCRTRLLPRLEVRESTGKP
jgi:DNA-binding LacI/PurR family transcriptional regulator